MRLDVVPFQMNAARLFEQNLLQAAGWTIVSEEPLEISRISTTGKEVKVEEPLSQSVASLLVNVSAHEMLSYLATLVTPGQETLQFSIPNPCKRGLRSAILMEMAREVNRERANNAYAKRVAEVIRDWDFQEEGEDYTLNSPPSEKAIARGRWWLEGQGVQNRDEILKLALDTMAREALCIQYDTKHAKPLEPAS